MLNRAYDRRNIADTIARKLVADLDTIASTSGVFVRKDISGQVKDVDCRLRAHAELWKSETEKVARGVQGQVQRLGSCVLPPAGLAKIGNGHGKEGSTSSATSSPVGGPKSRRGISRPPGVDLLSQTEVMMDGMDFEAAVLAQVFSVVTYIK